MASPVGSAATLPVEGVGEEGDHGDPLSVYAAQSGSGRQNPLSGHEEVQNGSELLIVWP